MDEKVYWIWLQEALRYGSHKVKIIKHYYKSIKDFYDAGEREWHICGCFTKRELESFTGFTLAQAQSVEKRACELGYEILTLTDKDYPELLSYIPNPPCVLYVKGDKSCLSGSLNIAVVGTRKATDYGIEMAREIGKDLSAAGAIVVSGGAVGVDCAAHEGALSGGGKTIAVLGCGINYAYLMSNALLREKISQNGAVVSEYPPDYPAYASNFPIRNRIISGLSLGTIVIEAGKKSGSLITANLANDQNRDVFVVPVDAKSELAEGAVGLIRDGAQVVTCAKDILEEYSSRLGNNFKINKDEFVSKKVKTSTDKFVNFKVTEKSCDLPNKNKVLLEGLDNKSKSVYLAVKNGKIHIDEISCKTEFPVKDLLPIITELELAGLIKSCSGRMYEINHNI